MQSRWVLECTLRFHSDFEPALKAQKQEKLWLTNIVAEHIRTHFQQQISIRKKTILDWVWATHPSWCSVWLVWKSAYQIYFNNRPVSSYWQQYQLLLLKNCLYNGLNQPNISSFYGLLSNIGSRHSHINMWQLQCNQDKVSRETFPLPIFNNFLSGVCVECKKDWAGVTSSHVCDVSLHNVTWHCYIS